MLSDAESANSLMLVPTDEQKQAVEAFMQGTPNPSSADVAAFLDRFVGYDREVIAYLLVAQGAHPDVVSASQSWLDTVRHVSTKKWIYSIVSVASAIASGYHGVKRNRGSVGWGLVWFILGGAFPVLTPTIAVAQGFGKPKAG
jgi:hypothetical protein